jgi:hypothetical protein
VDQRRDRGLADDARVVRDADGRRGGQQRDEGGG